MQYIQYEEAAAEQRIYDPLLLPGLVQTRDYARAIITHLADSGVTQELIDSRVEIRITRQQLLDGPHPPTLRFLIDESAIRRLVGEKAIAPRQLARLIELAGRPNITIEIIPFSAGLHAGMLEPFSILEFPDPEDSDVLYIEGSRESILSHDEADVISGYREVFNDLRSISLGARGSREYLQQLNEELS